MPISELDWFWRPAAAEAKSERACICGSVTLCRLHEHPELCCKRSLRGGGRKRMRMELLASRPELKIPLPVDSLSAKMPCQWAWHWRTALLPIPGLASKPRCHSCLQVTVPVSFVAGESLTSRFYLCYSLAKV